MAREATAQPSSWDVKPRGNTATTPPMSRAPRPNHMRKKVGVSISMPISTMPSTIQCHQTSSIIHPRIPVRTF
jgi:hypothetical protein